MADSNWIKLNRKIWDNFIWNFEEPKYAMAWIDLLLMANYADKKILFDGKVMVVKRGSFITSIAKLSERWSMNKRTVKRFLDMLQSDNMITYECSNKCTAIFISNYNAFQGFFDDECTADCTAERTADCTAECTQHKNLEESLKNKEIVSDETISSADVQRVISEWNKLGLSKIQKVVPKTTRHNLLQKRIKDYGVDMVLKAIRKVDQSDFLKGGGDKGWTATFDWFIKPDNFAKVLSGNYDPKPPKAPAAGSGRKEIVPEWMKNNRAKEDLENAKRLLADMQKTTGTDPELAARAEKLRQSLGTDNNRKEEKPNADRKTS